MFDLTGWKYLLTYGYSLKLYARGTDRIVIREDGKVIVRYQKG